MDDFAPSQEIRDIPLVKEMHLQTVNYLQNGSAQGSESNEPLGVSTAKFQPENEIRGLPEGFLEDTAVIDLVLKVQLQNSDADVTATALFKYTSDLPEVDNNWHITGVDLSEDDPRRAEIIGYINEGVLPTPNVKSYNLAEYDELVKQGKNNKAAGITFEEPKSH